MNEAVYHDMFEALEKCRDIVIPISAFHRMLRLGTGALLTTIGASMAYWILLVIGGLIALLGVYDCCPIWRALTRILQRN